MKILVTGGTGVIGEGVIPALIQGGHTIRLLTRGAHKDEKQWPDAVEPFAADVTDQTSLHKAAEGCNAVVHITGIIEESPTATFESVNVEGTRNLIAEAEREGARRFVYLSSLGADSGSSDYHLSKRRAEEVVRASDLDWVIIRPGSVYGPGDNVISLLLKMVRALPAVPIIDDGEQRFQPIWYEDLGKAVALALQREDLSGVTLEVGGAEITTTNDILDRLFEITGRSPVRVPVPSFLASFGAQLAQFGFIGNQIANALGVQNPINEAKLEMLREENFIRPPAANALIELFDITPLPLDEGLRILADSIPEQLPSEGFGPLQRKRFWADIVGSSYSPAELLEIFRARGAEIMQVEFAAEPDTPQVMEKGATLTASVPVRGNIQVRVEEVTPHRVTLATVEGHPLAGVVRFIAEPHGSATRFMVEIHTRAATLFDFVAMGVAGNNMQASNWEQVVERMVELSGGSAPRGVEQDDLTFDDESAAPVEDWIEELVMNRKREASRETLDDEAMGGSSEAASGSK